MKIKNVTIAGTGVLGSQIAFQSAFKGSGTPISEMRVMFLFQDEHRQNTFVPN